MAKLISDILEIDSLSFRHLIEDWERRTGKHGHDLKLLSDMRKNAVLAIRELGLDPTDTISGELYFALQERARKDSAWLAEQMQIKETDTPDMMVKKVIAWVEQHSKAGEVWVCKPSLIRIFLKKQTPKTTMKAIGNRSADSMLKRNSVQEILSLAYQIESPEWVNKFQMQFKRCKSSDFDATSIKIIQAQQDRTAKIRKSGHQPKRLVIPNYELGSIYVIAPAYRFPLDVLALTLSLAEAMAEIRRHSSLYRTFSVRKDFGQQLYAIVSKGITTASLEVSDIAWNSLHRHLVGNEGVFAKIEQPHLSREDLTAESSLDFLLRHDPRFKYWKDLEYSFFSQPGSVPVSLNLVDVVLSASGRVSPAKSTRTYGQTRLWEELWARYLTSDDVIHDVIDDYLKH